MFIFCKTIMLCDVIFYSGDGLMTVIFGDLYFTLVYECVVALLLLSIPIV